jgi:hypothetical protein
LFDRGKRNPDKSGLFIDLLRSAEGGQHGEKPVNPACVLK